jgi:serine/threonine-protein kinase HipA
LSGLRALSKNLTDLKEFPYTIDQQIELAAQYADKLSIQGVQPKLSVILSPLHQQFELVDNGGTFILKPQHVLYKELPQNEDLTMRLAAMVGIDIPLHGLLYCIDNSMTYFIKRFDRKGRKKKIATEDFSQLLQFSRETKYNSSMEQVVQVIDTHCSFPMQEKLKLFRLTLFNYLVGNEDMHLKNFSLIRYPNVTALSPAYDLVNTSIAITTTEEIALPLNGKKSNLKKNDLLDYFGKKRLGLNTTIIDQEVTNFINIYPAWQKMVGQSFLSDLYKQQYLSVLQKRMMNLFPSG